MQDYDSHIIMDFINAQILGGVCTNTHLNECMLQLQMPCMLLITESTVLWTVEGHLEFKLAA